MKEKKGHETLVASKNPAQRSSPSPIGRWRIDAGVAVTVRNQVILSKLRKKSSLH